MRGMAVALGGVPPWVWAVAVLCQTPVPAFAVSTPPGTLAVTALPLAPVPGCLRADPPSMPLPFPPLSLGNRTATVQPTTAAGTPADAWCDLERGGEGAGRVLIALGKSLAASLGLRPECEWMRPIGQTGQAWMSDGPWLVRAAAPPASGVAPRPAAPQPWGPVGSASFLPASTIPTWRNLLPLPTETRVRAQVATTWPEVTPGKVVGAIGVFLWIVMAAGGSSMIGRVRRARGWMTLAAWEVSMWLLVSAALLTGLAVSVAALDEVFASEDKLATAEDLVTRAVYAAWALVLRAGKAWEAVHYEYARFKSRTAVAETAGSWNGFVSGLWAYPAAMLTYSYAGVWLLKRVRTILPGGAASTAVMLVVDAVADAAVMPQANGRTDGTAPTYGPLAPRMRTSAEGPASVAHLAGNTIHEMCRAGLDGLRRTMGLPLPSGDTTTRPRTPLTDIAGGTPPPWGGGSPPLQVSQPRVAHPTTPAAAVLPIAGRGEPDGPSAHPPAAPGRSRADGEWTAWKTVTEAATVVHTLPDLSVLEHQMFAELLGRADVRALGPAAASIGLGAACERGSKHQTRLQAFKGCPYKYDKVRDLGLPKCNPDSLPTSLRRAAIKAAADRPGDALRMAAKMSGRAPLAPQLCRKSYGNEFDALFPASTLEPMAPPYAADLRSKDGGSWARTHLPADEFMSAVLEELKNANRRASPGVSGMRLEWLHRATMDTKHGAAVQRTIVDWVDGILAGADTRAHAVRLTLISKKEAGKYRPIGVGEAIAVVAGRVALRFLKEDVERFHAERGMWGGEKDACRQLGVRMAELWHQGFHIGTIDVANAFNEAERPVILDALTRAGASKGVTAYARHCLQPTTVVTPYGTRIIDRGVVQGDPQSPTLFATLMAAAAEEVVTECAKRGVRVHLLCPHEVVSHHPADSDCDVIAAWYADDGETAFKDVAAFATFLRVAEETLVKSGLRVGRGKTKVLAGRDRPIDLSVPLAHPFESVDALRVVGVPIGPPEAARRLLQEKVEDADTSLRTAWELQHPAAELAILRSCGLARKLRWVLEACPTGLVDNDTLADIGRRERVLADHLLGQHAGDLCDTSRGILTLPWKLGGLGVPVVAHVGALSGEPGKQRWKAFDDDERQRQYDARRKELVAGALPGSLAHCRLVDMARAERRSDWLTSATALSPQLSPAVLSAGIASAIGVNFASGDRCRRKCPMAGHAGKTGPPELRGGLHQEICAVAVKNQRHNAASDAGRREFRTLLGDNTDATVLGGEWGLECETQQLVSRKAFAGGVGQYRYWGDNCIRVGGMTYLVDYGFTSPTTSRCARATAELKLKEFTDAAKGPVRGGLLDGLDPRVVYVAIGMSTTGSWHVVSSAKDGRLPFRLSLNAHARIIAAGLLQQAEATVDIIRRADAVSDVRRTARRRASEAGPPEDTGEGDDVGRPNADTVPVVAADADMAGLFHAWRNENDDAEAFELVIRIQAGLKETGADDAAVALGLGPDRAVAGDGNCLYRALAVGIDGSEDGWRTVKTRALGNLCGLDDDEKMALEACNALWDASGHWEDVERRLTTDGAQGTAIEAHLAGRAADVSVMVLPPRGTRDHADLPRVLYKGSDPERCVVLRFVNAGHYDAVLLTAASEGCGLGPMHDELVDGMPTVDEIPNGALPAAASPPAPHGKGPQVQSGARRTWTYRSSKGDARGRDGGRGAGERSAGRGGGRGSGR